MTIDDHYYRPVDEQAYRQAAQVPCGQCGAPEENHRPMDEAEYARAFPLLFKRRWVTPADGEWLLDARRYWGGVGLCLTRLFEPAPGEPPDADESGMCLDFPATVVPGLRAALAEVQAVLEHPVPPPPGPGWLWPGMRHEGDTLSVQPVQEEP